MRTLLLTVLLIPIIGFAQIHRYEVTNENLKSLKKKWYQGREDKKESKKEFFESLYQIIPRLDFVLIPEIYLPIKDSSVISIEFIQDSVIYYNTKIFKNPAITRFDKNYGIGLVKDYMVDEKTIGVYIRKTFKNGNSELYYIKMHLDYALMYYRDNFVKIYKSPDDEFENYYNLND